MKFKDNQNNISLWTHQLAKEHEDICWYYKVDLIPPCIEIVDVKSYYGKWFPDIRTIRLRRQLIEEHSWDVVINSLKHEMGHQIVSEKFNSHEWHGDLYQKACDMIGVPLEFRAASGDVPKIWTDPEKGGDPETDKLLKKVEKILSLAQSKNEHEAALAMQRANELIKKYNLERIQGCKKSDYSYRIINTKKKRINRIQSNICHILVEFYFVKYVMTSLYDSSSFETHRTIELLGTRENVLIAEHAYYFLEKELNFLWEEHREKTGCIGKDKFSFMNGVLNGFREKLSQPEKKSKPETEAKDQALQTTSQLVLAKDLGLKRFIKQRFPRLGKSYYRGTEINKNAFEAGKKKGRKLTIHKAVSETNGFQGKMLKSG